MDRERERKENKEKRVQGELKKIWSNKKSKCQCQNIIHQFIYCLLYKNSIITYISIQNNARDSFHINRFCTNGAYMHSKNTLNKLKEKIR